MFLSDVKSEESSMISHLRFDFTIFEMTNITDYVIGKGDTNLRDFFLSSLAFARTRFTL